MRTKAPTCEGEYCFPTNCPLCFTSSLNPGVSIRRSDHLERHILNIFLDIRVFEPSADQSLCRKHCMFRICHSLFVVLQRVYLSLCCDTDHSTTIFHKGNDRRSGSHAFTVLDHTWSLSFHDRHAGVSCAEVNADHMGTINVRKTSTQNFGLGSVCWRTGRPSLKLAWKAYIDRLDISNNKLWLLIIYILKAQSVS